MPYIVKIAGVSLNITEDSMLSLLSKTNIAQNALRAAGVEQAPDICLPPAGQLIASVRLLEQHDIKAPGELNMTCKATFALEIRNALLTDTASAKTIKDLPNEILDQIGRLVVNNVCKDVDWDPEGDPSYKYWDMGKAFHPLDLLSAAQYAFGMDSHLRSVTEKIFFDLLPKDWPVPKDLFSAFGFVPWKGDYFLCGGGEATQILLECDRTFAMNARLHDMALQRIKSNMILDVAMLSDGDHEICLRADASRLYLDVGADGRRLLVETAEGIIRNVKRTKNVLITSPRMGSSDTPKNIPARNLWDLAARLAEVSRLSRIHEVLPGVEELTVCVPVELNDVESKEVWSNEVEVNEAHTRIMLAKVLHILRSLPVRRKSLYLAHPELQAQVWQDKDKDQPIQIDTTGWTDDEIMEKLFAGMKSEWSLTTLLV